MTTIGLSNAALEGQIIHLGDCHRNLPPLANSIPLLRTSICILVYMVKQNMHFDEKNSYNLPDYYRI